MPFSANAAVAVPAYAAKELLRSARTVEVGPGDSVPFTIAFKNVGRATWRNNGRNYMSVYTWEPNYRNSIFSDPSWISVEQSVKMLDSAVAPGAVGRFTFTLQAPLEEGEYKETFQLAAENASWVPGGKFIVPISVRKRLTADGRPIAVGYKAARMLVSTERLTLDAGSSQEFRIGFKNIGRNAWKRDGAAPLTLRAATDAREAFSHSSWTADVAALLASPEVAPGQLAIFTVALTAPPSGGEFVPRFSLMAGDAVVDGGEFEIPIEVASGQTPAQVDSIHFTEFSNAGPRGPNIRIGLLQTTEPVTFAAEGTYRLVDGDHNTVRQLSGVTTVAFDFATLTYTVRNGDRVFTTDKHVHLWPDDPATTIFEISSLQNRPVWDPTINFNRFRGNLEVFFSRDTGRLWVIEEVPVEDYMRGLAETTNASPIEFQKSLVTAARTYALFVLSIGGKHKADHFDLNTTGNDQVYKGYVSELVRPNVVRAVEETRGMVVTYGGEIVVTPYFSRSDGRTRAWTEVWSSKVHPWLVSVPAPYDAGRELWGHGVGMSASDAVGRAAAGVDWMTILKHYYTGVELKKIY